MKQAGTVPPLRVVLTLLWHQLRGHVLVFDSLGERPMVWRCRTCCRQWGA
jgi:hypothetical protein